MKLTEMKRRVTYGENNGMLRGAVASSEKGGGKVDRQQKRSSHKNQPAGPHLKISKSSFFSSFLIWSHLEKVSIECGMEIQTRRSVAGDASSRLSPQESDI